MVSTCIVMVTAPSKAVAHDLARRVLSERLVACVNVVGGVHSLFRWKGEIEEADEVVLLLKTRADRVDTLRRRVVSLHPYEVPEFVVLPIADGLEAYLGWIRAETDPRDAPEVKG